MQVWQEPDPALQLEKLIAISTEEKKYELNAILQPVELAPKPVSIRRTAAW